MNKLFTPLTWKDGENSNEVLQRLHEIDKEPIISGTEINIPGFFQLFEKNYPLIKNKISQFSKHINGICGLESHGDKMTQLEKINWFVKAIESGFTTVDIEYTPNFDEYFNNATTELQNVIPNFTTDNQIIVEYANFHKVPSFEESCEIIDHIKSKKVFLIKFICMAQKLDDNEVIFRILDKYSKDTKIIALAMGEIGLYSRINCVHHGSYATFGHFGLAAKACPGQIYFKDLNNRIVEGKN